MEPAPGERDDYDTLFRHLNDPMPQWSPLLVSGMTPGLGLLFVLFLTPPQWSPLLVSGMTWRRGS